MLDNLLQSFEKGSGEVAPSARFQSVRRLDIIGEACDAVRRTVDSVYPDIVPLNEHERQNQPNIDRTFRAMMAGIEPVEPITEEHTGEPAPATDSLISRQLAIENATQQVKASYDVEPSPTVRASTPATQQTILSDDHPNQAAIDEAYLAVLAAQDSFRPEMPEELSI